MGRRPLRAPLVGGALVAVLVAGGFNRARADEPPCTLAVTSRECRDAGGVAVEPVVPSGGTAPLCAGGSAKVRGCPVVDDNVTAPPPIPRTTPQRPFAPKHQS